MSQALASVLAFIAVLAAIGTFYRPVKKGKRKWRRK